MATLLMGMAFCGASIALSYLVEQLKISCNVEINNDDDDYIRITERRSIPKRSSKNELVVLKRTSIDQDCSICLEKMSSDDTLILVENCCHIYHKSCQEETMKNTGLICALCRK